ncbi:MAG: 3-oxoacyl-ACP reductase FabG [Rhizobacter sp.]|nr:3-oxoacyl-ACP reductase FabG [Rhizobacter sp.]
MTTDTSPPKRALVTGASGDLGRAMALRLARDDFHVIVHANSRLAAAQELVAQIEAAGGRAEAVAFNVADRDAAQVALAALLQAGPVQVLVNNAGTHSDAAFPALTQPQWQGVIDVSLNGFFNVTQPLTMPMIRTRWGRIISISSVASLTGNRGQVNYAAAKGALNSATKALSLELASRGITVNAVAPGIIDSGMAEGTFDQATIDRMVPMKRAGRVEEVAALVAFLASAEAGYITGQVISINGGMA